MPFFTEIAKICAFLILFVVLALLSVIAWLALLSSGFTLMLVGLAFGFLDKAIVAICLVILAVLLIVFVLAMMIRAAAHYLNRGFSEGRLSQATLFAGCGLAALIISVAYLVMPNSIRDSLVETATGESSADKQALPGTDDDRRWIEQEIRPQAAAGNARAQFALGTLYLEGSHGIEPDPDKGMSWIGKSAAQGNFDALLSQALLKRYPLAPDFGHVMSNEEIEYRAHNIADLIDRAPADRQAAVAMLVALTVTNSDDRPDKDLPMHQWLCRAAELGSSSAAMWLGEIVERQPRSPVEFDPAQAYALYAWAGASFDTDRTWRLMDAETQQRATALLEAMTRNYRDPHRLADHAVLDDIVFRVKLVGARGHSVDKRAHAMAAVERSGFAITLAQLGFGEAGMLPPGPASRWLQEQKARAGDCQARLALAEMIQHSNYDGGWARDQTDLAWAATNYRLAAHCAKDNETLRTSAEYGESMLRSLMLGSNRDSFNRNMDEIEAKLSATEQLR